MIKDTFKVFIAQPMHGLSTEEIVNIRNKTLEYIKDHYKSIIKDKEVELLDNLNHKLPKGSHRIKYLAMSIALLPDADLIYFVKGWRNAAGCRAEYEICKAYGLTYDCED